jgi:protein phosphatase
LLRSGPRHLTDSTGAILRTRDILLAEFEGIDILVNHHPSKVGASSEDRRAIAMHRMWGLIDSLSAAGHPRILSVGDFNEAIYECLESISNIIDSKGRSEPRYHNMGTTLVALAYYADEFYWMNCGDSRFYRMHDGVLRQISTDHSLSNLMGSSEHTNIITNCIGGGCKTSYIDMVNCTPDVMPGDIFLLCSDGLTDMVSDTEIETLLQEGADAYRLCDAANAEGGNDNVSVCVIRIL